MRMADTGDVRRLFRDTIALGRPLPFVCTALERYEALCLDWYLRPEIDARCAALGLPGWYGEINAPTGRRALALEVHGARVVHRAHNHTLSWLAQMPIERLTVARPLALAQTR